MSLVLNVFLFLKEISLKEIFLKEFDISSNIPIVVTVAGIIITVGSLTLSYLGGKSFIEFDTTPSLREFLKLLKKSTDKLQTKNSTKEFSNEESNAANISVLTKTEKENLIESISASAIDRIDANLMKDLEHKFSTIKYKEKLFLEPQQTIELMRVRIRYEINALSRRANINLVIGVLTTALAIIVLFTSFIFGQGLSFDTIPNALSYFVPRTSTVIFMEIFAFFFLKMYRNNLLEIKYYQNELTNIEFKAITLITSLKNDDKDTLKKLVMEFSKTERNFILQKDETTIEIETAKNQSASDKTLTDNLKTILESFSKLRSKE